MTEPMTLVDVRDWHRFSAEAAALDGHTKWANTHNELADAIDAHLAQPAQAVDVDYAPGELDRTAPERIWLQIDTSANNEDRGEPWPGADGVTWQDESIGGLEIQYVRADLVARALSGEKAGPVDGWTMEARRLYDVVKLFPEKRGQQVMIGWDGFYDLLKLRNHVGKLFPTSPAPDKEGA